MEKHHFKIAGITVFLIIFIQVLVGYAVFQFIPEWSERGQFGDVFGVVNALFSGLAFAGLIYAILLQREDLSLQRKELELTRQELKRSADAQQSAEIALNAQAKAAAESANLSTINFLLAHYREEIESLREIEIRHDQFPRKRELIQREEVLVGMLDSQYLNIIREGRDLI